VRKSKLPQYIGIAGITNAQQTFDIISPFPQFNGTTLAFAAGVLMNERTLAGETEGQYPQRYPPREAIKQCFLKDSRVFNVLHYCVTNPLTLRKQLEDAIQYCGPHLQGIQINAVWPNLLQLAEFREKHPQLRIILQIPPLAMQDAMEYAVGSSMRPETLLALTASQYIAWVDYILLDFSAGSGQRASTNESREYLAAFECISSRSLCLAWAGGLCAQDVAAKSSILREFPDVSLDAETRVRTQMPADVLNLEAARKYVAAALSTFM
jgi:hypothetical protein